MKRKSTAIISALLVGLSLMLGREEVRAQSEAADSGPLNLTVSLVNSPTIVLGEPILLKYVVSNSSRQKTSGAEADFRSLPLISERITDATGKLLVPSISPIPPQRIINGMIPSEGLDLTDLNGNTSRGGETVVNAFISFPHPGRYFLRVHVQNPYVIGDDDQGPRHLLSGIYVFPLTVTEANPAYLRATAERLRQSVLPTLDVNLRATLIKALFSIPEATASTSWQTLIEEPKLDGSSLSQIGTALARIHTVRATDILAEMVWEPAQPREAQYESVPEKHLYEMYDTGDAALRKHIEDLHKQHGVEMSHYRLE